MVNINNRQLCENCFSEIKSEPCPKCGFIRSAYKPDSSSLSVGSILNGRYLIGSEIGKGGFGITYVAYDLKLDVRLAVKEYYPIGLALRLPGSTLVTVSNQSEEEAFRNGAEKFYDEAKILARFNGNPNIVSVHDFFRENDTVYYIMAYIQGESLKSCLKRIKLTEGQAVKVMLDICNALVSTHGSNILHRDISPDNIMVSDDGNIRLLDFGAARQIIAEQSQSFSVILKQGFAPLEQYQKKGKQGPWTDIYSLGSTIYNALTGELLDDPMSRLEDDSELMDNTHGISDGLWKVVKKCIMLKIDDRYQTVNELIKDLKALEIEPESVPCENTPIQAYMVEKGKTTSGSKTKERDQNATELLPFQSISAENYTVHKSMPSGMQVPPQIQQGQQTASSLLQKLAENREKLAIFLCAAAVLFLVLCITLGAVTIMQRQNHNDNEMTEASDKGSKEPSEEETTEDVDEDEKDSSDDRSETSAEEETEEVSEEPEEQDPYAWIEEAGIGDEVTFGRYEQDGNYDNGPEDIEWRVLSKEDNHLLLISEFGLDSGVFNSYDGKTSWETCTLRAWLNDGFLREAFSSEEEKHIATVTVKADRNPIYNTPAGNDTRDSVFLLSAYEAEVYFGSDSERKCAPTAYAIMRGAWVSDGYGTCSWRLRTPGKSTSDVMLVYDSGMIYPEGDTVADDDDVIRPALWIKPSGTLFE